ncbi:hypothetical protein K0M31_010716 [Melipona bicolor]|uniref:Uncharacterized protein n=1 Tax=Melipona bicolor TaxID=60889 RepID=A0AA40KHW6_9HYME|nr:hypothetical protein K0M31_010716 [Melipona bicolor]
MALARDRFYSYHVCTCLVYVVRAKSIGYDVNTAESTEDPNFVGGNFVEIRLEITSQSGTIVPDSDRDALPSGATLLLRSQSEAYATLTDALAETPDPDDPSM